VEDVIPVSVTGCNNFTNDDRNNSIGGMKGDSGNNGYSKNLVCSWGAVYIACKLKGSPRIDCEITHTCRRFNSKFSGNVLSCGGIQILL
jgi:hypothetical protein